jgi:hypothetical protein
VCWNGDSQKKKDLLRPNRFNSSQQKKITHELLPITLEDAREDFKKIDDLTCETLKKMPPKSKVGNDAVDFFTYQERLNTKGNKHISFFDLYTNKDFFMEKTYVKNILAYLKKNSPNKSDLQIWRSIMGLYFGMPHIFKPLVAMEFYCRFKPTSVLDFTMGWGGRLLGACALDVPHYIGIDMNDKLRHPYEQMVKMVKPLTETKITLMFKDALTVDYSKLDYDMVFTSPPYYNIELYNKTTQQSKDEWDANFYDPIIRKTFAGLKMGGHYCLNIPKEVYERVALKILGGADIKVPLNKTQRQAVAFKGGTAYTEFVYIWKKKGEIKGGAITTYKDKFNKKYGFDKDQSHSVADIAKITGYKKEGLETIFDKGVGAYHTNPQSVRPHIKSPEEWAMARIYSSVMGGKAEKIDKSHLINGEGLTSFPITIEPYENLLVVRDDKLKGGTKSIFIPDIKERGIDEYVYASPAEGGFQIALAENLGDKATIFVAKRNEPHRNAVKVKEAGATLKEVPYGYMKNLVSKAKQYVSEKPSRKLIEWGGSTHIGLITDRMKKVLQKTGHLDEVWVSVGSGTLLKGIMEAVPPSTKVYGVQVGAEYKGNKYPNLHIIKYPKPFSWESKMEVPFPSNPNYDRKALEIALKRAKGKALFWNVAG